MEAEADSMARIKNMTPTTFPAVVVTMGGSTVTLPLDGLPVHMTPPEFKFDHVDEEIDWEALNLFDPLQDGAFRGPSRLSLTNELVTPLFLDFELNTDVLPQIPQTHLPFSLASMDVNMTARTTLNQVKLGMPNTVPPVPPVFIRSVEPANAAADTNTL
ncbi:hypothetical protein BDN71DRAFT_1509350 [Pleurotus eryngii]|uniref:Uncharacterized protein n=1 Tax=Pleurotus eryngii TaxID=5323 RepID=A0A9P5ZRC7_PLEER|nr:hypothetical protein BDN71DRAFT_1509350 [Pleurotus eryngii]